MCEICVPEKKSAVTMNGVTFCHDCLRFFQSRAKVDGVSEWEEVELQTKYISSTRSQKN